MLKAARLYDGRSAALTTPGLVVITGDTIVGVGPKAQVPEGAEVIDLGDATLLPGCRRRRLGRSAVRQHPAGAQRARREHRKADEEGSRFGAGSTGGSPVVDAGVAVGAGRSPDRCVSAKPVGPGEAGVTVDWLRQIAMAMKVPRSTVQRALAQKVGAGGVPRRFAPAAAP